MRHKLLCCLLGAAFMAACTAAPTPPLPTAPFPQPTEPSPPAFTPLPQLPITQLPITELPITQLPNYQYPITQLPTTQPPTLCSPLQGYTLAELPGILSNPFAPPRPGRDDGHHGADFAHWQYKGRSSLEGVAVQAILPGVVAGRAVDKWPYGNMIVIETPFEGLPPVVQTAILAAISPSPAPPSFYHLYAHMAGPPGLQIGDSVASCQVLGAVGNTGGSGNPHLHLEVRPGPAGAVFASMEYYKTTSTPEERLDYERWRFAGEFIPLDPLPVLESGE